MPIYEYKCHECELVFDDVAEDPLPKIHCPECGKIGPVSRTFSLSGIIYKGDGWTGAQRKERK